MWGSRVDSLSIISLVIPGCRQVRYPGEDLDSSEYDQYLRIIQWVDRLPL